MFEARKTDRQRYEESERMKTLIRKNGYSRYCPDEVIQPPHVFLPLRSITIPVVELPQHRPDYRGRADDPGKVFSKSSYRRVIKNLRDSNLLLDEFTAAAVPPTSSFSLPSRKLNYNFANSNFSLFVPTPTGTSIKPKLIDSHAHLDSSGWLIINVSAKFRWEKKTKFDKKCQNYASWYNGILMNWTSWKYRGIVQKFHALKVKIFLKYGY